MPRITIREGSTDLIIPAEHSAGGPGKKTGDVFFNEQMAFNRDVSVMLLRSFEKKLSVADAMSATGSRAVRIANEAPLTEVVANDRDPAATEMIRSNIELNGLKNCKASNRDLGALLAEEQFDYVDIDPFGSPMPFLHSAIKGCRRNGILAITATDTAPLAGANPKKCIRRYNSVPYKGRMCHDTGLRVLMATIARELAKFDRGMAPILSFYADHYFRTYVKVTEGAANADETLSNLVYLQIDRENGRQTGIRRTISKEHSDHGPFWGGPLHDRSVLGKMDTTGMAEENRCNRMLEMWKNELDVPFPYDISELSSILKISPPKRERLFEVLEGYGNVSQSHMSPTLFLTDADADDVIKAFKEASAKR